MTRYREDRDDDVVVFRGGRSSKSCSSARRRRLYRGLVRRFGESIPAAMVSSNLPPASPIPAQFLFVMEGDDTNAKS